VACWRWLGRNGAGKTTCISTIIGFLKPRGGEIRLFGEPIEGLSPNAFRVWGSVSYRKGAAFFRLSRFGKPGGSATAREHDRQTMECGALYTMFPRLRERHAQLAGTLSGGELQMLAIGRALMGNPRVLLLDEPSEGLAPLIVAEVGRTIRRLKDEGQSIILVEQNLKLAAGGCGPGGHTQHRALRVRRQR